MKAFLKAFVVLLLVFAVTGGIVAYSIASKGLSTRTNPSMAEETIALTIRSLATPRSVRNQPNPVEPTAAALEGALEHWADHCAACHANDGSGNTAMGRSFYPPSPDMRGARTQSLKDGELFSIIENGIRLTGMPAWGTGTPEGERESWALVHFIRRLPSSDRCRDRADGRLESAESREVSRSRRSTTLSRRYDRSADEQVAGETAS